MSDSAAREETIFNIARQLSHPEDRAAYLKDACGDDSALRERIERLLHAELKANEFLAKSTLTLGSASADRKTPEPTAGDVLEDYQIIEKIGGNMGLVYKARHRLLNKVVALKLLPAESIADPSRLARFQRELRVMGRLTHPNLVTAADARVVGCWHLVAMELIDGMDLQHVVEMHGALPIPSACEAIRQAALALEYAHEHGLIHRDIKPSNLMVTRAGQIKLIDMGLALSPEESAVQVTKHGMVLGTMRYCAPEQSQDASRVDIRADIYSLGCTLYHLLAGRPPYFERTGLLEVVQAHRHEPFPKLRAARPDAPAELETVLERMTAKRPEDRFATPGAVAKALRRFARGADTKQLLESPGQRDPKDQPATGGIVVSSAPPPGRPPSGAKRVTAASGRRPKRPLGRLIAASLLLTAVLAGVFLTVSLLKRERRGNIGAAATDPTGTAPRPAPIVVLMDTTAEKGIYDEENRGKGMSNTEVLKNKVLRDLPLRLSSLNISIEAFDLEWRGEKDVIVLQPDLVVIHRSVFFHPLNAVLELGYPPFTNNPAALAKWERLYRAADDKLITFMANVRSGSPRTKFLVYSTGTDANWMKEDYRNKQWPEHIGARFPALKGQVTTMVIRRRPDGTRGTFKDPDTDEEMRHQVKTILGLSDP